MLIARMPDANCLSYSRTKAASQSKKKNANRFLQCAPLTEHRVRRFDLGTTVKRKVFLIINCFQALALKLSNLLSNLSNSGGAIENYEFARVKSCNCEK